MSLLIQKLRVQRGWSQQQLADFAGLSVRTVQRIESGQKATVESLKALAAVFEVGFQELRAAVEGAEPSEQASPVSSSPVHDPEPAAMSPTTFEPAAAPAQPELRPAHASSRAHRHEARLDLPDDEVRAFRHVRKLRGFYIHLMIYVAVITGLVILNLWRTPDRLWVLGPMLGWGVGITAHALSVFGGGRLFGPEWERRQVEKQLGRKLVVALAACVAFTVQAPEALAANVATAVPAAAPGLVDILVRVPVWVWIVFGVLAVAGTIFRRGTTSRPVVTLAVSLGLAAWSLIGVVQAFGAHTLPLVSWAVGAALGAAVGAGLLAPRGLQLVGVGRVKVPGSWVPMVVMMGIFGLKFVHGVVTGAHLPLASHAAYVPVIAAMLGALSGVFLARAVTIVRFASAQRTQRTQRMQGGASSSRPVAAVPGAALAALVAVGALAPTADATAAGYRRVELTDADGAIDVAIWYPSDVAPQPVTMGPIEQRVAVGAPVRGERLPLVVFSHGTGGSSLSHFDTGIALADAGNPPPAVGNARDARVKAAVVAAPALGFTFGAKSLESIDMPVQLWRAEADTVLPEPHYVEFVRRS